ncbi:MAG: helix-turn-helix domain-containing protein [Solirubrobacteraceae bacterium]|nr:helix-turn-helix domain-containing protein [Solirubrobacteraceae bacterium]
MATLVVLAPTSCVTASVTLASDVLGAAAALSAFDPPSGDRIVLASPGGRPARGVAGRPLEVDAGLDAVDACDLVWIGSSWGAPERTIAENAPVMPFLRRARAGGATIAGVADAAFLMAEAGLLNGRSATVFPPLAGELQHRYPSVDVQPQRPMVDAGGVCTASGLASACDLLVRLVQRRHGCEIAHRISQWLLVDLRRGYDGTTIGFSAQRDHGDALVLRIQEWLESHHAEPVALGDVADRFAVSRRTLTRRFRAATGELPSDYLQRVRVEAARDLLRSTTMSVRDVMLRVGYQDRGAFLAAFRRHVGGVPRDERRVAH